MREIHTRPPLPPDVDTVLIDLDGTLVDSQHGILASLRLALTHHGYPDPGAERMLAAIGPPFEVGLPRLGVPADGIEELIATYRVHYEGGLMLEYEPYPGVIAMLASLSTLGLTLAVATAKPEPSATRIVDHVGLLPSFATIAGASHDRTVAGARRTKGEVIAEALRRLDIPAVDACRRVVMVGDREHDVEGADEHGIATIGAGWGYGTPGELTGAAVVCDTPAEVAAVVSATYRSACP